MKEKIIPTECPPDAGGEEDSGAAALLSAGAYPLTAARSGQEVTVAGLNGGKSMTARLADLGVIAGVKLKVICHSGGPMIIEVKGSRLSLGHGISRKILVRDR
jgi:Fe2+ transport system protein FeoA